jgi:hypothetical protein
VSQQFFAAAVPEADFPPFANTEYGIRALFKYLVHAIHHLASPDRNILSPFRLLFIRPSGSGR